MLVPSTCATGVTLCRRLLVGDMISAADMPRRSGALEPRIRAWRRLMSVMSFSLQKPLRGRIVQRRIGDVGAVHVRDRRDLVPPASGRRHDLGGGHAAPLGGSRAQDQGLASADVCHVVLSPKALTRADRPKADR